MRYNIRSFPISQQPLLLLQLLEHVFILRGLDQLVDCVDVALLRDVDPAVLLPNAVSPLKIYHRPWWRIRPHLSRARSSFHILLGDGHPVLVRVRRHRCLNLRCGNETSICGWRIEWRWWWRMAEVGMCTVCPLMHVWCVIEGRRMRNSIDASSSRAVVGV